MNKFIFSLQKPPAPLDFTTKSSFLWRLFSALFFITQIHFFSAQITPNAKNGNSAYLFVTEGAQIFSSDQSFNKQIAEKKIVIKGSKISYRGKDQPTQMIVSTAEPQNAPKKNSAISLKEAAKKKEKEDLKIIKKQLATYEAQKDHFQNIKINLPYSSAQFSHVQTQNKNYINPSAVYKADKIAPEQKQHTALKLLDFLHTAKYAHYNNKSLSRRFSDIFSIRPPPFFSFKYLTTYAFL